jgi:hypothetical protein
MRFFTRVYRNSVTLETFESDFFRLSTFFFGCNLISENKVFLSVSDNVGSIDEPFFGEDSSFFERGRLKVRIEKREEGEE